MKSYQILTAFSTAFRAIKGHKGAFLLFILMVFHLESQAQEIILSVRNSLSGLEVIWTPVNDSLWDEYQKLGYQLERRNEAGVIEKKWTDIKPRSKSWFESNTQLDNGFISILGQILYDEEMSEANQVRDQNRYNKYHYLVPETRSSREAAEALGLAILDTTCVFGNAYTYVLSVRKNGQNIIETSLTFKHEEAGFYISNSDQELEFSPPGGTPLLRMRPEYGHLNQLHMIGKSNGDSIVLRWAPNHHVFWSECNKAGYYLYRKEWRDVPESDSIISEYLLIDSFLPWPLERFNQPEIIADSMAMIAAEAIHGERMTNDEDGFLYQLTESEMRYGMAMLSADRSPLAAQSLGLRYVDRKVQAGLTYQYLLLSPATDYFSQNALFEIEHSPDTITGMKAADIEAGDRWIKINWSKLNDQNYSGYMIYKSENDRDFQPLLEAPLIVIQAPLSGEDEDYSYTDSIAQNGITYYYEIKGIDAFGDWSDPVKLEAKGIDLTPPPAPVIIMAESNLNGQILLKWQYPEVTDDLAGIHVFLSGSVDGNYELIDTLSANSLEYIYNKQVDPYFSYYFIVQTKDYSGNISNSLPAFVHIIDSIPPAAPSNLIGEIDSLGNITVIWDHVEEPDVIGYRVYIANHPDHEFSQLTIEPTIYNTWTDNTELLTLDKQLFFKVVAEDRSHNHSAFSEILRVNRPDIVPPAAPAALPSSSDESGITIRWTPSASADVVRYRVFRKLADQDTTHYVQVMELSALAEKSWKDTTAIPDLIYNYRVQAVDQSGLLSEWSFPVNGRRNFDASSISVTKVNAEYKDDMKAMYVQWNPPASTGLLQGKTWQFYLYRKTSDEGWVKIQQINSSTFSFLDRSLKKSGTYAYAVKIVLNEGKTGQLTESNPVEFNLR